MLKICCKICEDLPEKMYALNVFGGKFERCRYEFTHIPDKQEMTVTIAVGSRLHARVECDRMRNLSVDYTGMNA